MLEVIAGGPAERAGVRPGDLLVSLDGVALATLSELQAVLVAERIGRDAVLAFIRHGELREAVVRLAEAR